MQSASLPNSAHTCYKIYDKIFKAFVRSIVKEGKVNSNNLMGILKITKLLKSNYM